VTVEDLLAEARGQIPRFSPRDAWERLGSGAVLVDIRSDTQRTASGEVPGARVVERNVLEWRLDPSSEYRDPDLARRDVPVIVVCEEGYQSSLAAATLRRLGLDAGDLAGGFQAWLAAGLPVTRQPPRP
jgi:rhodanese-related sulfurtransferase